MAAAQQQRWFLAYWISRIGAWLGPLLPTRVWYAIGWPFAELCYLFMHGRRRTVEANLARVVGKDEAKAATRRVFQNFLRYVVDFYQLPSLGPRKLRGRMDFDQWSQLRDALSGESGILLVTMHLGQAELGAGALAAYGYPVNAIADTFDYPPMDAFIQGLRRDLGIKVIPAKKARMGVLRCLSKGEALALMIDVVEPDDGVDVKFFGESVQFSSTPARVAIRTGARVIPGVIARSESNPTHLVPLMDFDLDFTPSGDEEADVLALTQAIAARLENYVRRFPDQWFAFRPAWSGSTDSRAGGSWKARGLLVAARTTRLLPESIAYGAARLAGKLAYRFRPGIRANVQANMRHVLGPDAPPDHIASAAQTAVMTVASYYVDFFRLPSMELDGRIGEDVQLHGFHNLTDAIARGKGAIVATAHYGNPELAVQVGAILGLDILILAEPLQPPAVSAAMRELRSVFKPRYEDVSFSAIANSIRHLRSGGVLAIAADRDIQRNGTPLPFFGVKTPIPLGAAELAQRTGAALIPAYSRRRQDGFDIIFEEPLALENTGDAKVDALTNTRALLARMEEWIRRDPGQWFVLERFWKPIRIADSEVAEQAEREPVAAGTVTTNE